jgi:hypothetical protein
MTQQQLTKENVQRIKEALGPGWSGTIDPVKDDEFECMRIRHNYCFYPADKPQFVRFWRHNQPIPGRCPPQENWLNKNQLIKDITQRIKFRGSLSYIVIKTDRSMFKVTYYDDHKRHEYRMMQLLAEVDLPVDILRHIYCFMTF